jgi:hypothetical protein
MASTPPHDEALQRARFEARYGNPPEVVEYFKGVLLVGPVPENEWETENV